MPGAPASPETFAVRLESTVSMNERVRLLTFARVDGAPFSFQAGQWVNLHFPTVDEQGHALKRAYSIASPPLGTPRFELAVTHVDDGPGSSYLHAMQPGELLEARGPFGHFVRAGEGAPAPALFIATGTGLAPFRAMVHDAARAGRAEPVHVLFGARTAEDILWRDEWQALTAAHPWLTFEVTLSRADGTWTGRRGHVQEHVRDAWAALAATAPDAEVWLCGVKAMVLEVRDVFRGEVGLPRQRVHVESYG